VCADSGQLMGYLPLNSPSFSDMVAAAEEDGLLLAASLNPFQVLRPAFPPVLSHLPDLRK